MTKSRAKTAAQEPDQDKHPRQHLGSGRGWTLAQRVAEAAPDLGLSPLCGFWREQRWGGDHMPALPGSSVAWTQALRAQSPSPCPALPHAPAPSPPPFPRPRCCPVAPPALSDRERPLMAPLLILLSRRVAASALVLVAVSSKRDHLREQRDSSASAPRHRRAPARPLHPAVDKRIFWAVLCCWHCRAHRGMSSGTTCPQVSFVRSLFFFC